ncbi:hypothetical protein ES708_11021 [subsurface metagenome]
MKKIILLSVILIFLTGCGLFNLSGWIVPDDIEFLTLVEELDTLEKIGQYMVDNFGVEKHPYATLTPYQLYITRKGDCDDFSAFARFVAYYHNVETYQILISFPESAWHNIAIFKEGNCYTFTENRYYFTQCHDSFSDIMQMFISYGWTKYIVYDYWNNEVETGYNN